jgi:hypothetical protein
MERRLLPALRLKTLAANAVGQITHNNAMLTHIVIYEYSIPRRMATIRAV